MVDRLALALLFATLTGTVAFRDCTVPSDGYNPKYDHLLCGDAHKRCDAHQIPIVIDFSEVHHKDYVRELKVLLHGYKHKKISVGAKGTVFNYRYKAYTPDNDGKWPKKGLGWTNVEDGTGAARVMDTRDPGADSDLGTPNEAYLGEDGQPGPGVGTGGAATNTEYLGNALYIQEAPKKNVDDAKFGGHITFDFWDFEGALSLNEIALLDIEEKTAIFADEHKITIPEMEDNDNGVLYVPLGSHGNDLGSLTVKFQGSGAIVYLKGCIDKTFKCPPYSSGVGAKSFDDCDCNHGYYKSGNKCEPYYECPEYSTSAYAKWPGDCECQEGYYMHEKRCHPNGGGKNPEFLDQEIYKRQCPDFFARYPFPFHFDVLWKKGAGFWQDKLRFFLRDKHITVNEVEDVDILVMGGGVSGLTAMGRIKDHNELCNDPEYAGSSSGYKQACKTKAVLLEATDRLGGVLRKNQGFSRQNESRRRYKVTAEDGPNWVCTASIETTRADPVRNSQSFATCAEHRLVETSTTPSLSLPWRG